MAGQTRHKPIWRLIRRQHSVMTREQLLGLGLTRHGIEHRVTRGRLHRIHRGVFAVGRPELNFEGRCMAAVLACGPDALVSHITAAELWGLRPRQGGLIEISVPPAIQPRLTGVRLHRRRSLRTADRSMKSHVPVTSPARTILDLANRLSETQLETLINEAATLDLISPDELRESVDDRSSQRGAPIVRRLLDRQVFRLTDSELERRFLRVIREVELPVPETGTTLHGFRVDFFWPNLGLIVETDGLRYHRTPAQQARDRRRDQVHTAAGLTTVRFTHAQVRYEPERVREVLIQVAARLSERRTAA
jgi:very-short-patch-repair endonuclease